MICGKCKRAGRQIPFLPGSMNVIYWCHERCEAPQTCPCQHHITTQALRKDSK